MGHYNEATICKNGHVISFYNKNVQKYCSKCGKETYSICSNCGKPIRGTYEVEGVYDLTGYYDKPFYCYSCGSAYPWTQQIIDNAIELLSLDEGIDPETKELLKNAIPDLLVESPSTSIAVAKYKKSTSKMGELVKNGLYQLLVDVVSETVKKSLF